jgi:hypothetical protein
VRLTTDARLLRQLLSLHALPDPEILDVCANVGVMWRGIERHYRVRRLDQEAFPGVDLVGRWQDLPVLFPTRRFDVIAFDPPFLTQTGDGLAGSRRGYGVRYGTQSGAVRSAGPNIISLFSPFLCAARAVLRDNQSIIVAKIGDVVRSNRRQLQPVEFILAARAGFSAMRVGAATGARLPLRPEEHPPVPPPLALLLDRAPRQSVGVRGSRYWRSARVCMWETVPQPSRRADMLRPVPQASRARPKANCMSDLASGDVTGAVTAEDGNREQEPIPFPQRGSAAAATGLTREQRLDAALQILLGVAERLRAKREAAGRRSTERSDTPRIAG